MFNAFLKLYGYADGMNEHISLVFVFLSLYLYACVSVYMCFIFRIAVSSAANQGSIISNVG